MLSGWLNESFKISEFYLKNMLELLPLQEIEYPPDDIVEYKKYTRILDQMRTLIPHSEFSGIINKDGILFLSNSVDGFDFSDKDFFVELKNTPNRESIISNVFISPEGHPLVAHALKYGNSTDYFAGMALVSIKLDYFSNGIEKIRYKGSGRVSIVDENGIILARNSKDQSTIGKIFSGLNLKSLTGPMKEYSQFRIDSNNDGRLNIIGVRKMYRHPFYILIEEEDTIADEMIFPVTMILFGTFLLLFLAYVLMLSMLSQKKINNELNIYFTNSLIGIAILRNGTHIYRVNERMTEIFGYDSTENLKGRSAEDLYISKENFQSFFETHYQNLIKKELVQLEYPFRHKNGSKIWLSVSGQVIDKSSKPDPKKGVVWIFEDITKRRESEQKLIEIATTDSMTDLNNRRHFMELAGREFAIFDRHKRPLSLLMFDIDHFKKVNDTFGHAVGDKVISYFAEICRQNLRTEDIAGRIGGEEFACILPETDIDKAFQAAERIRIKTEEKTADNPDGIPAITVSIGVAILKDHSTLEELMIHADKALYHAKNNGRNKTEVFSDRLNN